MAPSIHEYCCLEGCKNKKVASPPLQAAVKLEQIGITSGVDLEMCEPHRQACIQIIVEGK